MLESGSKLWLDKFYSEKYLKLLLVTIIIFVELERMISE